MKHIISEWSRPRRAGRISGGGTQPQIGRALITDGDARNSWAWKVILPGCACSTRTGIATSQRFRLSRKLQSHRRAGREVAWRNRTYPAGRGYSSPLFAHDSQLEQRLTSLGQDNAEARAALLEDLLDLHGPGRVLFRNTRAGMKGFPKRTCVWRDWSPVPKRSNGWITCPPSLPETPGTPSCKLQSDLTKDPRVLWLVRLLQQLEPQKVLVIGRSIEKSRSPRCRLATSPDIQNRHFP